MVDRGRDRAFSWTVHGLLALAGFACVFPLLHVLSISLTPLEEVIRSGGILVVPRRVTFEAYALFLRNPLVRSAFSVTTVITVGGTLLNVVLTVLMGYALAQRDLPGVRGLITFVLVPMIFTPGLIPVYLVVRATGLLDSLWSLVLPGAVWSYVVIVTRAFFARMDRSLFEAARIDGAGELLILLRIVVPLSMPIIATISLYYGVGHWNEYFGGIMYISDAAKRPLQVVLRSILLNAEQLEVRNLEEVLPPQTLKMAAVVLAALPVVAVYPFLQRYFAQGIMLGAIKG